VLLYAIIAGVVSGAVTVLLPMLVPLARLEWSALRAPWWLGLFQFSYLRTAGASMFGLGTAAGISLSISDHSHHVLTYALWYGIGVLGLVIVIVTTIIIDSPLDRKRLTNAVATVTDAHAGQLKGMLDAAYSAIGNDRARGEDDSIHSEMFSNHYPVLDVRLGDWDARIDRLASARGTLRAKIQTQLHTRELDQHP
jgi:hypothetical protein